ncbi:MAG TPA: 23S rRNA (uracil(1939)-C(5))-methyltransferase RlmD [Clostridiaceae bacterium]|nr:23S rRNA (uracil(1939)-C(5))-methyltransferase RlmD [Clostridiaceae bacterium]
MGNKPRERRINLVTKGNSYTLDITALTNEGKGIGLVDGFIVFVDGALPGEKVEAVITLVKKSYAEGIVINILEESPLRRKPFCSAYERCGGCTLQHLDYDAQLDIKTGFVKDCLRRIGKLSGIAVYKTIGMENPFNYRNNIQFSVRSGGNGPAIGFFSAKSHDIVEGFECGIQPEIFNDIREFVSNFLINKGIDTYNEKTGRGLVRHLIVRTGFTSGEVMVVLVVNGSGFSGSEELAEGLVSNFPVGNESEKRLASNFRQGDEFAEGLTLHFSQGDELAERLAKSFPWVKELAKGLVSNFPRIKSVMLNINTKKSGLKLGDVYVKLYGKSTITDYIGDFRFEISPSSFFQVNPVQTEVLYNKVMEYASLNGNETVFDLYCGIGTISLYLSRKAKMVYGVEEVPEAVKDATENAIANNAGNVKFTLGKAEKVIPKMLKQGIKADVVVVDPPRKGCDEKLLRAIAEMLPKRMVYVSCNPATLARDLKYLSEHGMKVEKVQPVDMFPWTVHVETVVLIEKE